MNFALRSFLLSASLASTLSAVSSTVSYAATPDAEVDIEAQIERSHIAIAGRLLTEAEPGATVQIVSQLSRLDGALEGHFFGHRLSERTQVDLVMLAKSQLEMRAEIENETPTLLLKAALPPTSDEAKAVADHARASLAMNRSHLKEIAENIKLIEEVLNDQHVDQKTFRLNDDVVQRLRSIEMVESVRVADGSTLQAVLKRVAEIDASGNKGVASVRIFKAPKARKAAGPIVIELKTNNPRLRFSLEKPKTCRDSF